MEGSDAWPLGHPKSHMCPVPSFLVPSHSLEVRHDCQELGNSLSRCRQTFTFLRSIQIILGLQINTLFQAISEPSFHPPLSYLLHANFPLHANRSLYANHLPYVPKPQHLCCAESDDSGLGALKRKHLTQEIAEQWVMGKATPASRPTSLTACRILLPPSLPPPSLPASPFQVVMTIWSKYFDVSGMIKPRLACTEPEGNQVSQSVETSASLSLAGLSWVCSGACFFQVGLLGEGVQGAA